MDSEDSMGSEESTWTSGQCRLEVSINLRPVGISKQHRLEVINDLVAARFLEARGDRRFVEA
jgi:hypothetical protein